MFTLIYIDIDFDVYIDIEYEQFYTQLKVEVQNYWEYNCHERHAKYLDDDDLLWLIFKCFTGFYTMNG